MKCYQDYVIKGDEFIGNFEEMYQLFDDPWAQSQQGNYDDFSRQAVIYYIKKYQIKNCLQFGCGLGSTMNFVQSETNINMLGVDISPTAVNKANVGFPSLSFKVDTIENILNYRQYESFFFSELTWYLLEDKLLDRVFEKMRDNLKGKYFIHNLVFYKGQQLYGNDYFTKLTEFIDFCPFKLLAKMEINISEKDSTNTSTIFQI